MNHNLITVCLVCLIFETAVSFPNLLNYRSRGTWLFSHMVGNEDLPDENFKPNKPENESFLLELTNLLGIPTDFQYSTLAAAKLAQEAWHLYIGKTFAHKNYTLARSKRTNLMELAKQMNLTTLVDKLKQAGIADVLDHEGPFTLFAPTNEAFKRRPGFCDNVSVQDLMRYHVIRGAYQVQSLKNNRMLTSLLTYRQTRINRYQDNKILTANGRSIVKSDNIASNGVLHVLNDVMCAVYVGNAAVEINRCPPLGTFSRALNLTGLDTLLNGPNPLTVFVPTDAAFKKLPPAVLNKLFKNITALTDVILYHIVPDVWYKLGLKNGQILKSYQGSSLSITVQDVKVIVNNASVNLADATVGNGVVHSIDTVLFPPHYKSEVNLQLMP